MASRTSVWIFCDHTFKSAANIGFVRESDGKWIKLFKSVFIVIGEGDISYTGKLHVVNLSKRLEVFSSSLRRDCRHGVSN